MSGLKKMIDVFWEALLSSFTTAAVSFLVSNDRFARKIDNKYRHQLGGPFHSPGGICLSLDVQLLCLWTGTFTTTDVFWTRTFTNPHRTFHGRTRVCIRIHVLGCAAAVRRAQKHERSQEQMLLYEAVDRYGDIFFILLKGEKRQL